MCKAGTNAWGNNMFQDMDRISESERVYWIADTGRLASCLLLNLLTDFNLVRWIGPRSMVG